MQKYDLKVFQTIAANLGGFCESDFYVDCKTHLYFQCKNNHQWKAIPESILRGSWCPVCSYSERGKKQAALIISRNKNKINDFKLLAIANGFILLDDEYQGHRFRYSFKCGAGHEFKRRIDGIRDGFGCRQCYFDSLKTINITCCQQLAKSRNGFCISDWYARDTKLVWECQIGHRWRATYNQIKQGTWCPKCRNKGESEVRVIFESLLKKEFPQSYPSFLSISRHAHLQLDGYNEELGLAFEYDGPHHFEPIVYKGKSIDFVKQIERDRIKDERCREYGVGLIRVKYTIKNKKSFIVKRLKELGVYSEND
jgi:hypothetical protein